MKDKKRVKGYNYRVYKEVGFLYNESHIYYSDHHIDYIRIEKKRLIN